jgi:hypothetical protein
MSELYKSFKIFQCTEKEVHKVRPIILISIKIAEQANELTESKRRTLKLELIMKLNINLRSADIILY